MPFQEMIRETDKHFWCAPAQKKFTFPEKDPNMIDIDHMTVNEQTHLMKEGKCF
jgi:hypothetical protein